MHWSAFCCYNKISVNGYFITKRHLFSAQIWKLKVQDQASLLVLPLGTPKMVFPQQEHMWKRSHGQTGRQRGSERLGLSFYVLQELKYKTSINPFQGQRSAPVTWPPSTKAHLFRILPCDHRHTEDQASDMWTPEGLTPHPNHSGLFLWSPRTPLLHIYSNGVHWCIMGLRSHFISLELTLRMRARSVSVVFILCDRYNCQCSWQGQNPKATVLTQWIRIFRGTNQQIWTPHVILILS
jgi:hypothetical protein